jgi:hypothetical protein
MKTRIRVALAILVATLTFPGGHAIAPPQVAVYFSP